MKEIIASTASKTKEISKWSLDNGHVYLRKYKVIAIAIIMYLGYESHGLIEWYKENFWELEEWQNVAIGGIILALLGALKFALEHILAEDNKDV